MPKALPSTFKSALWVTKEYCEQNASRIAKSYQETDPVTGKSKLLERIRRKDHKFDGISDYGVISYIQEKYYRDVLPAQVAESTYIDSPPDINDVYHECQHYTGE